MAFLKPGKFQPRKNFADEALAELAAVGEGEGRAHAHPGPAAGQRTVYEIVAGERRWRAAQMAKLHDVPVVVRELADAEALEIAIIENVQRADLNAIEEAAAYQELMDRFGRTQEQVAQDVGKSRSHVANTIRLLRLPEAVKALLREGKLTAGHARTLLSAPDPEAARQGNPGRRNDRAAGRTAFGRRNKPGGKPAKDPNIADLEASISNSLGLKVQIIHKGDKGGEVRISYTSLEQLDEITRRLNIARLRPRPRRQSASAGSIRPS